MYKGNIPILKIYKGTNLVFNQQIEYDVTATFNVTSTSEPTKIVNSSAISGFTAMSIDGVQVDVTSGYTFSTTGEHTVQYKLKDETTITNFAFSKCVRMTSIVLPDTLTNLKQAGFSGCTSLSSIDIPDSVTTIGESVFEDCTSLSSVTIGSGVTKLGFSSFCNCSSLTEVTIPESVTNISDRVFEDCKKLSSITIPNSVTSIGNYTFYKCTSLSSVTIGNSVTELGDCAFHSCSSLTEITCLAPTAPKIGSKAFNGIENNNGTLSVPQGADYGTWTSVLTSWTIQYI